MNLGPSWRDRPAIAVYEQLNPTPTELTSEPVGPSAPGWRHVWLNTPPLHLLVHAHVDDERIRISHVLVTGEALDATQLISVPMGRIAKIIALTPPTAEPAAPSTPAERDELAEALATIASLTPRPLPVSEAWTVRPERPPLTRPPVGPGYDPDVYYRQVATAYIDLLQRSGRVAEAMADEAGVSLPTARSWIREARRRGHLEPRSDRAVK